MADMTRWRREVRRVIRGADPDLVEEVAQHVAQCWDDAFAGAQSENDADEVACRELEAWNAVPRADGVPRWRPSTLLAGIGVDAPSAAQELQTRNTERWRWARFEPVVQDVRYALRVAWRTPLTTGVALVSIAVGIGANIALYSVFRGVLLRPLPYKAADELVLMEESSARMGALSVSYADYLDWRQQASAFSDTAAYRSTSFNISGDRPEQIPVEQVSASFFRALGVDLVLGRGFRPDEDRPGAKPVVVLSDALWRRRFAGAADVLGRDIVLDGRRFRVVGVAPADFHFLFREADAWVPAGQFADATERQNHVGHRVLGRIRPGVTVAQARDEMGAISRALEVRFPDTNKGIAAIVSPLEDQLFGRVRPMLTALLVAVGLVLVVACANVANLLLARGNDRRREMAVRAALGAMPARIAAQLITESLVLTVIGAASAVVAAIWTVPLLARRIESSLPLRDEIALDANVLVYALLLSIGSGVFVGLFPAFLGVRARLAAREAGKAAGQPLASRMRSTLMVVQVGAAVLLVAGAGALLDTVQRLAALDVGFRDRGVLALDVSLPETRYADSDRRLAFFDHVLGRARALPGVEAVAVAQALPFSNDVWRTNFLVDRHADDAISANYAIVSEGYFRALGVPLVAGRYFGRQDLAGRPTVAIVDEEFARRAWAATRPRARLIGGGSTWLEVIGVVGRVRNSALDEAPSPQVYLLNRQYPEHPRTMSVVVRTTGDPHDMAELMRQQVVAVDADQPIYRVRTMAEVVARTMGRERIAASLLVGFAIVALTIAAAGLYGVVAYAVSQRTREIGIRLALGAHHRIITRTFAGRALALALCGTAAGLIAAAILFPVLAQYVARVQPPGVGLVAATAGIVISVAAVSAYLPARRVSRIDPIEALRQE